MDTDARGLPQAVVRVGQQRIARRQVLKWGLAGLGLSVAPLLAACGGGNATPPPPGAGVSGGGSAQPTVAAAGTPVGSGAGGAQTTVNFQGWDYEPPLVEQNIKRFESLNPTIKVSYTPITSAEYRQKMVAQFTANANPDGLYVRDDYF